MLRYMESKNHNHEMEYGLFDLWYVCICFDCVFFIRIFIILGSFNFVIIIFAFFLLFYVQMLHVHIYA